MPRKDKWVKKLQLIIMIARMLSVWFWFGSNRPGFCLGTFSMITLMLLMYAGGIQASLSLGPGGDFPKFKGNYDLTYTCIWYLSVSHRFCPNSISSAQMCSCMLSVTTSSRLCWSVLLFCCCLDHVRNDDGGRWPSSLFLFSQWPYYLFFTPWSSLLVGLRRVASVVTLPSSWRCLLPSVVRWLRGGSWGVCQSGFCLGSFCWLVCCCCQGHRSCFTSVQYALDTTVSFHLMLVQTYSPAW